MRALGLSLLLGCAPVVHEPARVITPAQVAPSLLPQTSRIVVEAAAHAEPSVAEVVQMALDAARSIAPDRVHDIARRARLSGLVPQLRVSVERGLKQDLSSSTTTTLDKTNTALGDDLTLSAGLSFELSRLVFATDEVRLMSVERWLAGDQRKLVHEVVKLYFQRRRLVRQRALATAQDGELEDSIAEVEAQLDALTNGAFSR